MRTVEPNLTGTVYSITNCYGYNPLLLRLYCYLGLCNTMSVRNLSDRSSNEPNI